jgi:hypothetical protein
VEDEYEVDVEHDGEHGTKNFKIIKRHVGEGESAEELLEEVIEVDGDNGEKNVFILKTDGPHEHPDGEGKNVHLLYISGPEEFLEKHPEADLDGDGELSDDEFRSFAEEMFEHHLEIVGPEDGDIELLHEGAGEKHIRVEIQEGEEHGDHLIWVGEGAAATTEGKKVIVKKKITADGKHLIFVEEGDAESAQKTHVERKKDFLAEHPEADSDGDGVISKEEAEAFAAKLQTERKKKE